MLPLSRYLLMSSMILCASKTHFQLPFHLKEFPPDYVVLLKVYPKYLWFYFLVLCVRFPPHLT